MTAPAPLVRTDRDLPLRRVLREELVSQPGDFTTIAFPAPLLPATPDTPTHVFVVCDHYGAVHRIPCTTGKLRAGLWVLTGTTKQPNLRPHVTLTQYKGYVAFGVLTPTLA